MQRYGRTMSACAGSLVYSYLCKIRVKSTGICWIQYLYCTCTVQVPMQVLYRYSSTGQVYTVLGEGSCYRYVGFIVNFFSQTFPLFSVKFKDVRVLYPGTRTRTATYSDLICTCILSICTRTVRVQVLSVRTFLRIQVQYSYCTYRYVRR